MKIDTNSPSESVLAIVAADAVNASQDVYREALTTMVEELLWLGVILNEGSKLLYSRILLMLARDQINPPVGCGRRGGYQNSGHPTLSILNNASRSRVTDGPPHSRSGKWIPRTTVLGRQEWVNSTHFGHLDKPISEVTEDMLLRAWAPGYAVVCASDQGLIYGFLVVYTGDMEGPFDVTLLCVVP